MNVTLTPRSLGGTLTAPLSKSHLHRALICAALAGQPSLLRLGGVPAELLPEDIGATVDCLRALGTSCTFGSDGLRVTPAVCKTVDRPLLDCAESGSTLRFLLPVAGALGANAVFTGRGRLPQRPLSPLREQLCEHGMTFSPEGVFPLCVGGKLQSGSYCLRGDVSSQFISGLLFALPLTRGDSELRISGRLESEPYVLLTQAVMRQFGVQSDRTETGFYVPGDQRYHGADCVAEGDWSGAAFWLAAGALSKQGITVRGLQKDSLQGDRRIAALLSRFGAEVTSGQDAVTVRSAALRGITADAGDIPDLVPVLAAAACVAEGETLITGAARLRLKESDRLAALCAVLGGLGADIHETPDGLRIFGKPRLRGGTADSCGDHRIAMAAAIVAERCEAPVTITRAEVVRKSYPRFFEDFSALGGAVEAL